MPNDYFQFKQFTIWQDQTAMKVGTDGVLLGAWSRAAQTGSILDIGTGTGLLALMMAQRTPARVTIEGIEIAEKAYQQAKENIKNSPWHKRICLYHQSYQDFYSQYQKAFDLIITNPPFFDNSLQGEQTDRNLARHSHSLSIQDLLQGVSRQLKKQGRFALILPFEKKSFFNHKALFAGLYPERQCTIKTTPDKTPKRILIEYARSKPQDIKKETLVIKTRDNQYTTEYKNLLKPFYLYL